MKPSIVTPLGSRTLRWAAIYNLAFGAFCVLAPHAAFTLVGSAPPEPLATSLWQCIGMIVGVYGIAYGLAARDYVRHWPIVLVGLLGKVLGPIGFLWAASHGAIEWRFLVWIVANDLVWWVPFMLLLRRAAYECVAQDAAHSAGATRDTLRLAQVDGGSGIGRSLAALSLTRPVLLVMLRHAGCVFCREMVAKLAEQRKAIEASGKQIVLVHMSSEADMTVLLARHRLEDLHRISDPNRVVYRALGLRRGTPGEIAGPKVWWRAFVAAFVRGHGIGKVDGDVWQMPGVFLVKNEQITWGRQFTSVAELVDFAAIAREESVALARPSASTCATDICNPAPTTLIQL